MTALFAVVMMLGAMLVPSGAAFLQATVTGSDNPTLRLDLDLDPDSPTSVAVAPLGIAVSEFNPVVVENASENDTSIAAASFASTNLANLPIGALPISALPISAMAQDLSSPFNGIPLVDISLDTEGGWPAILEGTNLAQIPLVDVTLGDVVNNATADSNLARMPISALEANGTPISTLPISALLLGGLPISALDAADTTTDWCAILGTYVPGADCAATSLVEASLAGTPISALPISSLPISELPISSLPISELPISDLDLRASPISGLPVAALDLTALPISAVSPQRAPSSTLPVSALSIGTSPISALELGEAPISALELRNVPISARAPQGTQVSALPLGALPLSALLLQDVPLAQIVIDGDWCDVLTDLEGYDCSFGASDAGFLAETTIYDLGVRGVPISALPIGGVPMSALDVSGLTISTLPIDALPIGALPISALEAAGTQIVDLPISALPISTLGVANLASVPISSLDLEASPFSTLPISALDFESSPIATLPIGALPISALPISALEISELVVNGTAISALTIGELDISTTPISAVPISALPISARSDLGIECDLVDCHVDTINDAVLRGAIPGTVTVGDLRPYLGGIRLGDLADEIAAAIPGATLVSVIEAAANSTLTLGELGNAHDLTLGELPTSNARVQSLVLGDFAEVLWKFRLSDLIGAIIDPTNGEPYSDTDVETSLEQLIDDLSFTDPPTVGDLRFLGDMTLADLLSVDTTGFTLDSLGPILGLVHITDLTDVNVESRVLGDLAPQQLEESLGGLTLLDLLDSGVADLDDATLGELFDVANANSALLGFDLGDLLLALLGVDVAPVSNLDFTAVETGDLPASLIPSVKFVASVEVRDTPNDKTVKLTAQLPATASYIPGSATAIDVDDNVFDGEPVVGANTLTWTLTGVKPETAIEVTFDIKPTVTIGATNISATALIVGTDIRIAADASIDVVEGIEPSDFPATTAANGESVYLTYISSETDNDVFSITVQENDQLAIQLAGLTADLDFALYGTPANGADGAALTNQSAESPLWPITDPDQAGADTEPLNDFRRLDDEDPTLEFIGLSNAPGTETESLVTGALAAGEYLVQVFGANGAINSEPAVMQIQVLEADVRPECAANGEMNGARGSFPANLETSTANTLILVNQQRTEALFPGQWSDLETEVNDLVTYLAENPELGIEPVVASVDGNGIIQDAYNTWDADNTCSPESANAVVEAIITNAVDPLRDTLEHIVIVGGDQVIPMARLADATEVANEYDFRHEFIGDNAIGADDTDINVFSAIFWDRQYLSDEPYGESAARSLGNRYLYVSDIALGRMVETPDEIQAALELFQDPAVAGILDAETATILGYDFLTDSSVEIAADLAAAGLAVDDDLADGFVGPAVDDVPWTKDDAEDKVVPPGGAADLISLNGHFDHYRALPADGDQVPSLTNNFLAQTMANSTPGLLEGSIVFSMGCHGGLTVSDGQIRETNGDWAQTFAADQAIFVGNTGCGYGDTEAVAYTEKLMTLFAEQAVRPVQLPDAVRTTTIGQALTFAKNEYASDLSVFSVYDEKALMESTFYGLPFYRVGATPVAADPIPNNATSPDSTGNQSLTLTADPENTLAVTPLGSIYSNEDETGDPQTIVAPGMPIQPSQSFDVSVVDTADTTDLSAVARGALVLDMVSTYQADVDPVVSAAVFNESDDAPEPPLGSVVFPTKPVTINSVRTPEGDRQNLVLATGQFDSDGSVQRLDDDVDVVVYYADASDSDYTAPTIGVVESTLDETPGGAELGVTLTATDSGADDASEVTRVYLLIAANPGNEVESVDWIGLDLAMDPGSDGWSGSALLPSGTTRTTFLVQAVDGSGNVAFATNKARNFNDGVRVVTDIPTEGFTVTLDPSNLDASGWYTGPVDVTVDSGGLAATYLRQPGGVATPVPAGGVFSISRNGVNHVTVTRSNGQTITNTIRIDTDDPNVENKFEPVVSIATPASGAIFFESSVPKVGFVCQDPSLISCVATVGGVVIGNADPLPSTVGAHVVSVTARDALGNSATVNAGYVVETDLPLGDPPTITDVEIDGIAHSGEAVDVFGEFVDGVGPYSIAVDWGNGDVCPREGKGNCSVAPPVAGRPGIFEASYTYPVGGSYSVEVTITDTTGSSVSKTLSTAICTITGTDGDNYINGTSGDDVICGLGGNDTINGRGGADVIFGGTGEDLLRGGSGPDQIYGGRGNDVILGQEGADMLSGGRGNDLLSGSDAADVIKGRGGNDVLVGGEGNDILFGDAGSDQLYGSGGDDDLIGGRGADIISGSYGADIIDGGLGDDTVFASFDQDIITGGPGKDWISAGAGNDTVDGGDDDDDLRGDWGDDTIEGGDGNDRCRGGNGSDQLTGCES